MRKKRKSLRRGKLAMLRSNGLEQRLVYVLRQTTDRAAIIARRATITTNERITGKTQNKRGPAIVPASTTAQQSRDKKKQRTPRQMAKMREGRVGGEGRKRGGTGSE